MMGRIIAVAAVLFTHIDKNAVTKITPSISLSSSNWNGN